MPFTLLCGFDAGPPPSAPGPTLWASPILDWRLRLLGLGEAASGAQDVVQQSGWPQGRGGRRPSFGFQCPPHTHCRVSDGTRPSPFSWWPRLLSCDWPRRSSCGSSSPWKPSLAASSAEPLDQIAPRSHSSRASAGGSLRPQAQKVPRKRLAGGSPPSPGASWIGALGGPVRVT